MAMHVMVMMLDLGASAIVASADPIVDAGTYARVGASESTYNRTAASDTTYNRVAASETTYPRP